MAEVVRQRPRPLAGLLFAALPLAAVVVALPACMGEAQGPQDGKEDQRLGAPPAGAVRGELVVYTATFDDGTSDEQYYLRVGDREQRLLFEREPGPDFTGGARIDVWGLPEGEALRVLRSELVLPPAGIDRQEQALVNAPPARARRFAFVLVDIGMGVNITQAQAEAKLFGIMPGMMQPSVRQYYIEASYGHQDVGGQVFGPIKYAMQACNTRGLADTIRPMIPGTFDHYLWYIGSKNTACQWSGLASSGSPAKPSRDTWYNASSNCVVLVQEPGHNFGMAHSSSMKCMNNQPFADAPMGTCVHSEYGDSFDPMGRACRHMNAAQKAYEGWFGKCNVVNVGVNGTFTLLPLELPCDGIQALQIPFPKVRPFFRSGGGGQSGITELTHYFVELRAPIGIDKSVMPQVQIRASTDTRLATQKGAHSWFLDMNPATPALDGLTAGGSFTDPGGGVKITVESLDATKATVKLEFPGGAMAGMGAPTCMDDTPLQGTGAGPESCSNAPSVPMGQTPVPVGGAGGSSGSGGSSGTDAGARDARGADAGAKDTGGGEGGASGGDGQGGAGGDEGVDAGSSANDQGGSSGGSAKGGSSGGSAKGGSSGGADETPPVAKSENVSGSGTGCALGGAGAGAPSYAGLLLVAVAFGLRRRRRH